MSGGFSARVSTKSYVIEVGDIISRMAQRISTDFDTLPENVDEGEYSVLTAVLCGIAILDRRMMERVRH